ncbi:MAG: DUF1838 domain-containing protein [Chroococcidiopsidaceae cyanobacterium CP_BM_ER_R8_30]|nr:DUF1838 domain-containing protein [Chroococcidiopsidaceae cyanobacterium CP_BM_ER_R8_30]
MVATVREFDAKEFVKVRSSLDANPTFLTWAGSIYAFVPNEPKKRLFKIIGMSVSRCIAAQDSSWDFTSRELTYYLDPNTGGIVHKWENPWTGEILPVIHVANNPVQGHFKGNFPAKVDGDLTTFIFDLFPTYPNPLAEDTKFVDYSPNPTYQAVELFKLTVPTEDLLNSERVSVSRLFLSWDRIGPWLPWMKMGERAGHLIYSASGRKVNSFADLPQLLQDEINTRVPLFKDAPKSLLDREDMTSWIYFKQHFNAYLAGDTFPIPEPEN